MICSMSAGASHQSTPFSSECRACSERCGTRV
jgi:hypothetical protein